MARIPKNYQGNLPTGRLAKELLPDILRRLDTRREDKILLLKEAWPKVVGPKLAPMTSVEGFEQGTLRIKLTNSTLLSVLAGQERDRLLQKMREIFPSVMIKNLHFFIG